MPIVGSFAGASARAYGLGAGGVLIGDFESISTTTLGGNQASINITSIPQTYTHLQLRMFFKTSATDLGSGIIQFNGDTASNYSWHVLGGNGSSAFSTSGATQSSMLTGYSNQDSTYFGVSIIDILDYKDTNKYKTIRVLAGLDRNGSGYSDLVSGNWRSTSAVTSILLTPQSANYSQYSSFALYGVKA
jgi:hypothetical protein